MPRDPELESLAVEHAAFTEAELDELFNRAAARALTGQAPSPDAKPGALSSFFEALRDELRRMLTEH